MIVSLTPHSTIDLTVFIPKYLPDTTIRATQTHYSLGGKPTDAAWILGRMGVPSLAWDWRRDRSDTRRKPCWKNSA